MKKQIIKNETNGMEFKVLTKLEADKLALANLIGDIATEVETKKAENKQPKKSTRNLYKIKMLDGTEIEGDTKLVQQLSADNGGSVHLMGPTKKSKAQPGEWIPLFKTGLQIIKL